MGDAKMYQSKFWGFGLIFVFLLAASLRAHATPSCAAGGLSTIAGTTCDIGSMTFSFGGLNSNSSNASDFNFTPVSNGFTLSFLGESQSITAPSNSYVEDYAYLDFTVLSGEITQAYVSGDSSPFSVSGTAGSSHGWNENSVSDAAGPGLASTADYDAVFDNNGSISYQTQTMYAASSPIT